MVAQYTKIILIVLLLGGCRPSATPVAPAVSPVAPTAATTMMASQAVLPLRSGGLLNGFDFAGPIDEAELTLPKGAALPSHVFEGRLELLGEKDGGRMEMLRGELDPDYGYLPEFDFELVQHNGYLIPVRRGLIIADHPLWNLHLEPGRAWQEAADGRFSRASLPFALTVKGGNATFNDNQEFTWEAALRETDKIVPLCSP